MESMLGNLLLFLQFLDITVEFTVEFVPLNLWKQIFNRKIKWTRKLPVEYYRLYF